MSHIPTATGEQIAECMTDPALLFAGYLAQNHTATMDEFRQWDTTAQDLVIDAWTRRMKLSYAFEKKQSRPRWQTALMWAALIGLGLLVVNEWAVRL
jgi:hypothetical protein